MGQFITEQKQIVFVDIVNYSLRSCNIQYDVIMQFMKDIDEAITSACKEYGINKESVIVLSSGDGAAIVFPFQKQHNPQGFPYFLFFIRSLLALINTNKALNGALSCDNFKKNKHCQCHTESYCLRVGASIGELIIYKDFNTKENYAGTAINMAARVMGILNKANQVTLTKDAYQYLKNFYPRLCGPENFSEYKNVKIKHNEHIDIYQYIDAALGNTGLDISEFNIEANKQETTKDSSKNKKKKKTLPKLT